MPDGPRPVVDRGHGGPFGRHRRRTDKPDEAERAFTQAIEQTNLWDFRNEAMLAQELIDGTEYVVNAVSGSGRHHVVSLAYYRKERGAEGGPIYRQMIFIPADQWESSHWESNGALVELAA